MKKERAIIGGLLILQIILWLGFLVHRSTRFSGSLTGGIFGILGALLMIIPPIIYSAVKRIESVKKIVTAQISLGTLLNWHVYTSIVGAIFAIIHSGHNFESPLGIWLTAMMLLTVLSGFVGRYFLNYTSMELREKQDLLNKLATEYNQIVGEMSRQPNAEIVYATSHNFVRNGLNSLLGTKKLNVELKVPPSVRAVGLAESIADLEYAIKTHELLKRRTIHWLIAHIVTSCAFYFLLIFHIWSALYFGLRWFK